MATARDRSVWLQILDLYHKEYPYLWDKSHGMYNNQAMRDEAFENLTQMYRGAFDQNATTKIVKKKIGNMRTTYFNELKKVKDSLKAGDTVYKPTLWYYDQLNFLANKFEHPSINSQSTTTNSNPLEMEVMLDITIEVLISENNIKTENTQSEPSPPSETNSNSKRPIFKRKHKFTVIKRQESPMNNMPRIFTTVTEDWEVLGRSIGLQLRDISQKQLTIASKLISDTIYYAKLNKLTEDSRVEIGLSSPQYTFVETKIDL